MRGSITIDPRTSLYLKLDLVAGEKQTAAEPITGKLALKVKKLVGSPSLTVGTDSVSCGVRGTEFEVEATPGGPLPNAASTDSASSAQGNSPAIPDAGAPSPKEEAPSSPPTH